MTETTAKMRDRFQEANEKECGGIVMTYHVAEAFVADAKRLAEVEVALREKIDGLRDIARDMTKNGHLAEAQRDRNLAIDLQHILDGGEDKTMSEDVTENPVITVYESEPNGIKVLWNERTGAVRVSPDGYWLQPSGLKAMRDDWRDKCVELLEDGNWEAFEELNGCADELDALIQECESHAPKE